MKWHNILILTTLLFLNMPAKASLFEDLLEHSKICDAGLLSEAECKVLRTKILKKYDTQDETVWFCNYAGENKSPNKLPFESSNNFSESASATTMIREIIDASGLLPNFVVRPGNVPNASAIARSNGRNIDRYIEYNPTWLSRLKSNAGSNWAIYSVMAHEIGHHLQGHTLKMGGSRPDLELEADNYSGFILQKLGASITEAQLAMNTIGSNSSSGTHPKKQDRLISIKAGWNKACGNKTNCGTNIKPDKTKHVETIKVTRDGNWGAIATSYANNILSYGYSYRSNSEYEAQQVALDECDQQARGCSIGSSFKNSCFALYFGENTNTFKGRGGMTRTSAKREAFSACNRVDSRCDLELVFCADGSD